MANAEKCQYPKCHNQTLTGMCWRHQGKKIPMGDTPASVGIFAPKLAMNWDNRLVSAEAGGPIDNEQYQVIESSYAAISRTGQKVGKAIEDLAETELSSHDQEIMKMNHYAPFMGASMRMSDLVGELRAVRAASESGEVTLSEKQTEKLIKLHNEMEDLQSRISGVKRIVDPMHHQELDRYSKVLDQYRSKLNVEVLSDLTG